MRAALATLVPLAFFALLEGGLRLCNYGYPTTYFIKADADTLTTNPKFAWQFYPRETATSPTPLRVTKAKPAGTKRVVLLGESAAAGTPDPAYSFSRMLGLMLEDADPKRVEVINAAMRGIDSHIVAQIAAECAQLGPDLFIVYAGNNDLIGLHSPDPGKPLLVANPLFIRVQHAVKATRTAQLLGGILRRVLPAKALPAQGMDYMRRQALRFDDPRRNPVYRNYRRNLETICDVARRAGAKTLLCTVAVNLHDFPPLQSLHRRDLSASQLAEWDAHYAAGSKAEYDHRVDEAMKHFQSAAAIDDHHAELLFRLARCQETAGRIEDARRNFALARDWDALQFRSDSRVNAIVREVAARAGTNRVWFADVEKAFTASTLAPNGVPGELLFQEHVHFLFDGDFEVARALAGPVRAALGLGSQAETALSRDECARRLAYTKMEAANILSALARLTAKPPFLDRLEHGLRLAVAQRRSQDALQSLTAATAAEAQAVYEAALARRTNDWMLRYNYARLLSDLGQHSMAVVEYEKIARMFPENRIFRQTYGVALMNAQRPREAVVEFAAALKLDPDFAPARQGLAQAMAKAGL